ncbi:MAG: hypothetical protein ACO3I1_06715 [Burkholderiales bacterium]
MRFAGEAMAPQPEDQGAVAYSPQEKAEDKMILKFLQEGGAGRGENIDKQIQQLINKISGVGVRGV